MGVAEEAVENNLHELISECIKRWAWGDARTQQLDAQKGFLARDAGRVRRPTEYLQASNAGRAELPAEAARASDGAVPVGLP